jgi:3-hydroxymyristoyl/3-hydroxydecanoyl-(acyl carrier protein) dehydratase
MRLEYFQLIDRIVELDVSGRTIRTLAQVPQTSTIFEGHFPGHPLMPGVLLTEAMAQTSGWLIIGLTNFTRMPFLAGVKEAKLRTFVPRQLRSGIQHRSPPRLGRARPKSPTGWRRAAAPLVARVTRTEGTVSSA